VPVVRSGAGSRTGSDGSGTGRRGRGRTWCRRAGRSFGWPAGRPVGSSTRTVVTAPPRRTQPGWHRRRGRDRPTPDERPVGAAEVLTTTRPVGSTSRRAWVRDTDAPSTTMDGRARPTTCVPRGSAWAAPAVRPPTTTRWPVRAARCRPVVRADGGPGTPTSRQDPADRPGVRSAVGIDRSVVEPHGTEVVGGVPAAACTMSRRERWRAPGSARRPRRPAVVVRRGGGSVPCGPRRVAGGRVGRLTSAGWSSTG
jgi:hypothetical protein